MEPTIRPFPNGPGSTIIATRRGRPVRVRHITASDDQLLVELYQRLSPQSRWLRFFRQDSDLPDQLIWREAIRLSHLDPLHNAALVGLVAEAGVETAVGVARLARLADTPAAAEVAVLVRDDYQREGLGTMLLDLVVQVALVSGLRELRATSLVENVAVQRLVRASGFPVVTRMRAGEAEYVIALSDG